MALRCQIGTSLVQSELTVDINRQRASAHDSLAALR
jgi:hypothetical protein